MRRFRRTTFSIILLATLIVVLSISKLSALVAYAAQTSWLEEAWGQAGAVAYEAAAKTMLGRNNLSKRSLDNFQKLYLRDNFNNQIDRVAIVYDAQLMDWWVVGGMSIHLGTVDSTAQTYCDRVYIRSAYQPKDINQLIVLAHEMVHVRQCQQLGGIKQFGYTYFKEYKRANQKYEKNKLEKEAFVFQKKFATSL
jgi:Domain of unknown function (DUF4157)